MAAMDPIIRSAPVSPVTRRIGRPAPAVPAAPAAPAVAVAPTVDAVLAPAAVPLAPTMALPTAVAVSPVPAEPVVPARDYAAELARAEAAHEEALATLAKRDAELARCQADVDTLREAQQKAAIDLADAYADAETRGYAAGEKKGLQDAKAALQAQVDRVGGLFEQIGSARGALMESAEDAMVDIVFAAICRILGERGADRDTIRTIVRETVASTREREQVVARLHPDDAALLKGDGDLAGMGDVRISADASIALGGCIIDGPGGTLDARFDTQLELLAAALKAARAGRQAEQDAA